MSETIGVGFTSDWGGWTLTGLELRESVRERVCETVRSSRWSAFLFSGNACSTREDRCIISDHDSDEGILAVSQSFPPDDLAVAAPVCMLTPVMFFGRKVDHIHNESEERSRGKA